MFRKIKQLCSSLTADGVLAILFLGFCFYVGAAAFPQFLVNSGYALEEETSLADYIDLIDDQYYEMLPTDQEIPLLQNKATYINLNGQMAKALDQREINEVIKLNNGYLSWDGYSYTREEMASAFQHILPLAQKQLEQGKEFLFVLAPSKTYQEDLYFPQGYEDTTNSDAAYFLGLLEENGVPYLDLRQNMAQENIAYEDAFYVTDHHWKTQLGFWAYARILEKLEAMGSIPQVDPLYTDPENFRFTVYEDSFLGSMGRRTGEYYAGTDDFCIITPKFETDISVSIPSAGLEFSGPFETTAYNRMSMNILEEQDYFNDNPYGLYGWSDRPLTSWSSRSAPMDRKVMLIGNSYGNVPFAFMPLYFSSCEELDMRHFTEDFTAFYDSYSPDIVILLVHLDNIASENTLYPYFQNES